MRLATFDRAVYRQRLLAHEHNYERLRRLFFMHQYIPLILTVVMTNALSQILLKHGMNTIGKFDFNGGSLMSMVPEIGRAHV